MKHCNTCKEDRRIDELEEVEIPTHEDDPVQPSPIVVCLFCGDTVHDSDPFEGVTLEEYND